MCIHTPNNFIYFLLFCYFSFFIALIKDSISLPYYQFLHYFNKYLYNDYIISLGYRNVITAISIMISLVATTNIVFTFIYDKKTNYRFGLPIDFFLDVLLHKHAFITLRILTLLFVPLNIFFYFCCYKNSFFIIFLISIFCFVLIMLSWSLITSNKILNMLLEENLYNNLKSSIEFALKNERLSTVLDLGIFESKNEYKNYLNNTLSIIKIEKINNDILNIFQKYIQIVNIDKYETDLRICNSVIFVQIYDFTLKLCNNNFIITKSKIEFQNLIESIFVLLLKKIKQNDTIKIILLAFVLGILKSKNKLALSVLKTKSSFQNQLFFLQSSLFVFIEILEINNSENFYLDYFYAEPYFGLSTPKIDRIAKNIQKNEEILKYGIDFLRIFESYIFFDNKNFLELLLTDLENFYTTDFIPHTFIMQKFYTWFRRI